MDTVNPFDADIEIELLYGMEEVVPYVDDEIFMGYYFNWN